MRRRLLLGAGGAAALLAGCRGGEGPPPAGRVADIEMRWVGAAHERGHRLRDMGTASAAASALSRSPASAASRAGGTAPRRVGALVLGGGVAGLAAARALARRGIDDVHVLELEDAAGGNARGHAMGGIACPLGAHYLPVPGPEAHEVGEWLHDIGLLATGRRS